MATRSKRADENMTSRKVEAFAKSGEVVAPPPGVTLRSDEEKTIWNQFTRARAQADWRDMDLLLLGKVVHLEADMRELQKELKAQGYVKMNTRGTEVENALVRILDTLLRQQLAVIRSMSLNTTTSDPRTVANQAKADSRARTVMEEDGVESLLASPVN